MSGSFIVPNVEGKNPASAFFGILGLAGVLMGYAVYFAAKEACGGAYTKSKQYVASFWQPAPAPEEELPQNSSESTLSPK